MSKSFQNLGDDEIAHLIGAKLRLFRKSKGWSQLELGINADVDRSYIGRIENGRVKVTVHVLTQLANALDIKLSSLLQELDER